jgi:hypothetical protein
MGRADAPERRYTTRYDGAVPPLRHEHLAIRSPAAGGTMSTATRHPRREDQDHDVSYGE